MRTKGGLFLHTKNFVLERFGAGGWASVLQALPPDDARAVDHILAVGWYDTALLARLYVAVGAALTKRDALVLEQFSAWAAEQDLTTTYRLFLRMANPAFVLEKSGSYWERFHDSGSWVVVRLSPTAATGTLSGFLADETFCRTLAVYMRRMFELVGAKGVRVEHPRCRGQGHEVCLFDVRWRA